ncbi:hypothetical protein [Ochrobactrum sp. EDr1-4]
MQELAAAKSAVWKEDNRPALQSSNVYAKANGYRSNVIVNSNGAL